MAMIYILLKILVIRIFQTKIVTERIFFIFIFYENDEAKFFFRQKELVFIGCVQYMISWKYCAKL